MNFSPQKALKFTQMHENDISYLIRQSAYAMYMTLGLEIRHAQLLTYLKLPGHNLNLLINFNVPIIKQGIFRKVNGLEEQSATSAPPSAPSAG